MRHKTICKKGTKLILIALSLFGLLAFTIQDDHFTVFLAGDSTMSIKQVTAYPETGWGMPFANYFNQDVTIDNRAKNGRSTKTFITEGLWDALIKDVKPNDYVFIQFGHNDEVPTKASYTPEADYRNNLIKFITDTRNKQAFPVLLTPVTRRYFDTTGHIKETHLVYSKIVRAVADEYKVPLIDLDEISRSFFEKYGPENSKFFFNHLEPGENPNYANGYKDDTHLNELGARSVAELVIQAIRDLKLPLANNIVKPTK